MIDATIEGVNDEEMANDLGSVFDLTFPAVVTGQVEGTLAKEFAGQVDTSRGRRTRILLAIDDIFFACFSSIARRTDTGETWSVVDAGGAVFAGTSLASVVFVLATNPREIIWTGAIESGTKILTASAVHARISDASLRRRFTLFSIGA